MPPDASAPQARRSILFFRLGAFWLLAAAAGHAAAHYRFYVDESAFPSDRLALVRVMEAFHTGVLDGTSLWTILQMFSLAFGLLLAFAGACNLLLLGTTRDPGVVRRFAGFNAVFWSAAAALVGVMHPVLQTIVIAGTAFLLFGASYLLSPDPENVPGADV